MTAGALVIDTVGYLADKVYSQTSYGTVFGTEGYIYFRLGGGVERLARISYYECHLLAVRLCLGTSGNVRRLCYKFVAYDYTLG